MNHLKSLFAMCCLMAALVAGCGSSNPPSSGSGNVNGVFLDAAVVGLNYACGTQSGVTAAGGTLACPAGSSVTFSVGGITVCTAPFQATMTPLSCAQATNASANTSTASVIAAVQFLLSISTTPASSGTLTITSAELQAAASQTLNFSTATQTQLQAVVSAINPGASLVSMATAQNEITTTVLGALAGSYSGTYSGSSSGTWSLTIASSGAVSGTGNDSVNGPFALAGSLTTGTTFSGTTTGGTWTGTVNTSMSPAVLSGTWSGGVGVTGTFTGTEK